MGSKGSEIHKALRKFGTSYLTWIKQRFIKYSAGGGTWPPLSAKRIKAKGHDLILFDTGQLQRSLDPRSSANKVTALTGRDIGVKVEFTSVRHKTGIPIADLIEIHHFGTSKIPARPILVEPPKSVVNKAIENFRKAIKRANK